jgi:hypothetical protein
LSRQVTFRLFDSPFGIRFDVVSVDGIVVNVAVRKIGVHIVDVVDIVFETGFELRRTPRAPRVLRAAGVPPRGQASRPCRSARDGGTFPAR